MKKYSSIKRTLYYFGKALWQYKTRTILTLVLVTIWIFVSNVVVPYGTSEIIGKLSSGDFAIQNYADILLLTIVSAGVNNLAVIRAIDWLDWSLDAKCGEYLSQLAFTAVINQSMTFHANRFSGSLTSQANKLPNAFIMLKSNFVRYLPVDFDGVIFNWGGGGDLCTVCSDFGGVCGDLYGGGDRDLLQDT